MRKDYLRHENGYTLIEMITVLAISSLLIVVAGVGIAVFLSKYNEFKLTSSFYQDSFQALQTIKNGLEAKCNTTIADKRFMGVINSKTLDFNGQLGGITGSDIILYPDERDLITVASDRVRFYKDNGYIRATYVYNDYIPSTPIYLFPAYKLKNPIQVTKLTFKKLNNGSEVKAIQVNLEATCQIRKDLIKKVKYSTVMSLIAGG